VVLDLRAAFDGKRVLVAGGLGFIGSHVSRRLLELGAGVSVVDALVPGCGGNPFNLHDIRDSVEVTIGDVRDDSAIGDLVEGRDYVFNLAGQVSHVDSIEDPGADLENNCRAPLSVLEACRRRNPACKVVYASTRQIYGRPRYLPVDESHPCDPVDVNGVHKWAGERYHSIYHSVHGIGAVSLRLTNTYGPGQLVRHPRQGFMGWFLRQVVEGGVIEVMGDGDQLRDLNFVEDVVEAMLLAAASPDARGQVYNLGGQSPISLRALSELMIRIGGNGSLRFVPFPADRAKIDIGSVYADYGKIRRELGWEPRVSLEEGLERSIRFLSSNLSHYLP
jgi:UDP-glucose 4-epimerase